MVSVAALILLVVGSEQAIAGKNCLASRSNYTTVDLRGKNLVTLCISQGQRSVILERVILEPASRTQLVIDDGDEPARRAQRERGQESTLDIEIKALEVDGYSPAQDPTLEIDTRKLHIGKLKITGSVTGDASRRPLIAIKMQDDSRATSVELVGLRAQDLNLALSRSWPTTESKFGNAAEVLVSDSSFQALTLGGVEPATPVNIHINADVEPRPKFEGVSSLSLSSVRILSGLIVLGGRQTTIDQCNDDQKRIAVKSVDTIVGERDEGDFLHSGERGNLTLILPEGLCFAADFRSFENDGSTVIRGGRLEELVINDATSDAQERDSLEIWVTGLSNIRLDGVSMSNFEIHFSGHDISPEIVTWEAVNLKGTILLPDTMFTALNDKLYDGVEKYSDHLGALRSVLVDTRWRSYSSDTFTPTASDSLLGVLRADSRRIFGGTLSTVAEWFTGFGIERFKPIAVGLCVLFLPTLLLALFAPAGTRRTTFTDHVLRLVEPHRTRSPNTKSIENASDAIATFQRWLFVFQLFLVGLFIQNAVLVGS